MRISFRQGIVHAPANFLELNGSTVDLSIATPEMVNVAFADKSTDYLHTERVSIQSAWTGPFSSGAQSFWLYWDINTATGQRTFGHTLHVPADGPSAPSSPANDQHWFDTTANQMKVWSSAANRWIPKVRVFAAMLAGGSVFISMSVNTPLYTGTQVGLLENTPTSVGAIIFDVNGDPIRRSYGFFTTEDVTVAGVASAAQVKLGAVMIQAVTAANIPAYSIVNFTDFNEVNLATNVIMTSNGGAYGMIEVDAITGDVVSVALEGVITNPLWDWTSAGVNAPLYVSLSGTLTATPPPSPVVVATVVDTNTVLLRPSITTVTLDQGGGGGGSLSIKDEGTTVQTAVTALNIVGPNVTAAAAGTGAATITIAATPSSLVVRDEGTQVQTAVTALNFVGAAVTASAGATGVANISVAVPAALVVQEEGTQVQTAVSTLNFVGATVTASAGATGVANIMVTAPSAAPKYDLQTASSNGQTAVVTSVNTVALASGTSSLQVFRNGVLQYENVTYTVTGPHTVTFSVGLTQNDQIAFYSFA